MCQEPKTRYVIDGHDVGALRNRVKKPGPKRPRSVQSQLNTGEQGDRPSGALVLVAKIVVLVGNR